MNKLSLEDMIRLTTEVFNTLHLGNPDGGWAVRVYPDDDQEEKLMSADLIHRPSGDVSEASGTGQTATDAVDRLMADVVEERIEQLSDMVRRLNDEANERLSEALDKKNEATALRRRMTREGE